MKPRPISITTWAMAAIKEAASRWEYCAFNRHNARDIWASIGFENSPLLLYITPTAAAQVRQRSEDETKRAAAEQAGISRLQSPAARAIIRRGVGLTIPSLLCTGASPIVEKFVLSLSLLLLCCAERGRVGWRSVGVRETAVGEPAYSKSNSYIAWYLEVTDTSYNWDSSLLEAKNRWRQGIKFVE